MRKRRAALPRHSWSYYHKRDLYERLCQAVRRDDSRRVEDFLTRRIGPDQPLFHVTPALSYAVIASEDMVKLLLERGANPSCCDDFGFTPLMDAARYGQSSVMKLLLEYRADVHAKDMDGHTALTFALEENNQECVALLREAGATE